MSHRKVFLEGMKDAIPIGLGYLAVAFSLGISARGAGLTPFQGFLASFSNNASAGQYAGFTLIAADAAYIEIAVITLVTNARYMLMSCVLSQRMDPEGSLIHRFFMGYIVTDELFAITIARPGILNPYYTYGAITCASPFWAVGTAFGIAAGNVLPMRIVSALSVALFGMFLAVIIPPARKSKIISVLIIICFAASYITGKTTPLSAVSPGTRTIVLTVVISVAAALIFPLSKKKEAEQNDA